MVAGPAELPSDRLGGKLVVVENNDYRLNAGAGASSHLTRRWRETDSNRRSLRELTDPGSHPRPAVRPPPACRLWCAGWARGAYSPSAARPDAPMRQDAPAPPDAATAQLPARRACHDSPPRDTARLSCARTPHHCWESD